jgi:hypothetical protein
VTLFECRQLGADNHLSPQHYFFKANGNTKPCDDRHSCRHQRGGAHADQDLANEKAVNRKRNCADDHRPALCRHITAAVLPERERERCQRNGRRGSEQAREAFGAEHVPRNGEQGNDEPAS